MKKKRLILAFTKVDFELTPTDIVLVRGRADGELYKDCIDIDSIKFEAQYVTRQYENLSKKIDQRVQSQVEKLAYIGSIPSIYMVHNSLYKWTTAIADQINNGVEEVILTDHVNRTGYAPFYEAEGERHVRLLYEPYELLSHVLLQWIEKRYSNIKITVINKRSSTKTWFRKNTRRYVLLIAKFILFTHRYAKRKLTLMLRSSNSPKSTSYKNIYFTRGQAHFDAISNVLKEDKEAVVFCGETVFGFGNNYQFAQERIGDRAIPYVKHMKYNDVIFALVQCVKMLVKNNTASYKPLFDEFELYNIQDTFDEAIIHAFEGIVYHRTVERFISRILLQEIDLHEKLKLITCEMYTLYAYSIAIIGEKYGVKNYQLQSTNMFVTYEPDYFFCDKFIYESKLNFEQSIKARPDKSEKAIFLGTFKSTSKQKTRVLLEDKVKVCYFTQPATDEDIEQEILIRLVEMTKMGEIDLIVKLHPRDSIAKIERFKESIEVVSGQTPFENFCNNIDIAVMKTSSIATKLVLEGIPVVYCLFSDWAKQSDVDYIDHSYYGAIYEIEELPAVLRNKKELSDGYIKYRDLYLDRAGLKGTVREFVDNLNTL